MPGSLHHVELRVPDLGRACAEWGWLLACIASTGGVAVELAAGDT